LPFPLKNDEKSSNKEGSPRATFSFFPSASLRTFNPHPPGLTLPRSLSRGQDLSLGIAREIPRRRAILIDLLIPRRFNSAPRASLNEDVVNALSPERFFTANSAFSSRRYRCHRCRWEIPAIPDARALHSRPLETVFKSANRKSASKVERRSGTSANSWLRQRNDKIREINGKSFASDARARVIANIGRLVIPRADVFTGV